MKNFKQNLFIVFVSVFLLGAVAYGLEVNGPGWWVDSGTAASPAIKFGDGDSGFFESSDDQLNISTGGTERLRVTSGYISTGAAGSNSWYPYLRLVDTSSTSPVFTFLGDNNTGIGRTSADNLALISGGLESIRVEDPADLTSSETSLWLFDDDNNTMEQVTVGSADSCGAGYKCLRIPN